MKCPLMNKSHCKKKSTRTGGRGVCDSDNNAGVMNFSGLDLSTNIKVHEQIYQHKFNKELKKWSFIWNT